MTLLKPCELRDFAEELSNWEPMHYPLICLAKHELEYRLGLYFYVDKWPSCSAVVVVPSPSCKDSFLQETVYVDALDSKKFENLLNHVPIDWTKQFYFLCIYQTRDIYSVCEKISEKYGSLIATAVGHNLLLTERVEHKLPDGYIIDQLTLEDIRVMVQNWPYSGGFSSKASNARVEHGIKYHPTVAVRDLKGNLVAYEMISHLGSMCWLYVHPDHRGKGLAKAVISQLSKKLSDQNKFVYCNAGADDDVSIKLHKKCGFNIVENADIIFKPEGTDRVAEESEQNH